jgi:predicted phosphoadenosine phosphosulfate sulfurtransferase
MSTKTTAERNAIKRAKEAEAAAYAADPFANYESISTPEGTEWRENERYPRFLLTLNSYRRGDGNGLPRNP